MQGIRRLEQSADIADESAAPSPIGGVAVGIALLGLIILLVGGGIAGWNYSRRPVMIDVDYMSPWDTWLMWQSLREGVRMQEYADSPYQQARKEYTQYMTVGFVIIGVGIFTLVCALAVAIVSGRSGHRKIP